MFQLSCKPPAYEIYTNTGMIDSGMDYVAQRSAYVPFVKPIVRPVSDVANHSKMQPSQQLKT